MNIDTAHHAKSVSLLLNKWISKPVSYTGNSFCFLNQELVITDKHINWNFNGYGKLWSYNLHYMDYLLQANTVKATGLLLIDDYIKNLTSESPGFDPYPISLRGINWIKFCTKHDVNNPDINNTLYHHYNILYKKLEFHLLGNHLIENVFSLLYGSFYFDNLKFFNKSRRIIEKELKTQILSDGGHFERSPMYHQIILDRLLDCINLLQNNKVFKNDQDTLLLLMEDKARLMIQWLNRMTFINGEIPMVNDSAPSIAPATSELNQYAKGLGLISDAVFQDSSQLSLKESGYRKFLGSNYECTIDVGEIGPDFQPGHAHADTFSFVLQYRQKPFIVDTGVSTYEKNERRLCERGTSSHNTVQFEKKDSSEVWGGFRVGRRARIISLHEKNNTVTARHDGYKRYNFIHERVFNFSENSIEITDKNASEAYIVLTARLHLHPDVNCRQSENQIVCDDGIHFEFIGHTSIKISQYMFASAFNRLIPSKLIELTFEKQLKTIISM